MTRIQTDLTKETRASDLDENLAKEVTARKPLSQKEFAEIAGAVGRLEEIKEMSALAKTKEIEAEATGLVEYLTRAFLDYSSEFLGCWWTINTEYQPMIKNLVPLFRRVSGVIAWQDASAKAQEASKQAEPKES